MVLGATLALGGCSVSGCSDDVDLEPKMPPLARPAPAEPEEALELPDVDAEAGRMGTLEVAPGFVPDPVTQVGTTAGGPVDAHEFDDRCDGWMAAQPDVILHTPRPIAELSVMVASAQDTTLMVVGPDHEPRCGDDEDGAHPIVRGPFAAGEHRVWVGTRARGASVAYSLAVSELDDSMPSSLLH